MFILMPTSIPKYWPSIVLDIKDCFYTICIHPVDNVHFTFFLPSLNLKEPLLQCQWTILPQGMTNFPIMYKYYIGKVS